MEAIGLLELTWTSERKNVAMTAKAFALLNAVDQRLTPQAKSSWRWRILLLRAEVDSLLAANGNQMVTRCHLSSRDFAHLPIVHSGGSVVATSRPVASEH